MIAAEARAPKWERPPQARLFLLNGEAPNECEKEMHTLSPHSAAFDAGDSQGARLLTPSTPSSRKRGPCALARPPALSVKEHECSTRTAFRPEGCCGRSGKLVLKGDSKRLAELPFSDCTAYQLPEQKRSGRPALPLKRDTATGPALLRRLLSDPRQGLLRDGRRRPNLGWKGGNGEVGGCLFSATEEQ